MINRIRANHYNLNKSLGRKGFIKTIRCDCGDKKENISHIIYGCEKYEEERQCLEILIEDRKERIFLTI